MSTQYQMYRETSLGLALKEVLDQMMEDELIPKGLAMKEVLDQMMEDELIPKGLAMKVLATYDKNINKALAQRAKAKVQFNADKLLTYNLNDNVWTLVFEGVSFRDVWRLLDGKRQKVKFVACDGRAAITGVAAPAAQKKQ